MKEKNATPELNTTVSFSARSMFEKQPQAKAARAKSLPALGAASSEAHRRLSAPAAHAPGKTIRKRSGMFFFVPRMALATVDPTDPAHKHEAQPGGPRRTD